MRLHGHLVEIDWDGDVLDVRGTNADGRALVNAGTDDGRLRLASSDIDEVVFRDAPRHVGGLVLVVDVQGAEHRLHFRRGGREEFHRLYEELDAAAERARALRPAVVDLTEQVDHDPTAAETVRDDLVSS